MTLESYILHGGAPGAARLEVLARAYWPTTRALLERVGVRPGMRVLDLGCGRGDVTVELARLVAPGGAAVGIDADGAVLEHARALARERGVEPVFEQRDALEDSGHRDLDLVYARFLLSHVRSPEAAVARMRRALRPGGLVVVEDVDFPGHFCHPPCAAFARYVELYMAAARLRGADATIGPRLPALLLDAGLEVRGVDVVQPAFVDGDGKLVAQLTMAAIRDAVVTAGLASAAEVEALIAELDAYRTTPGTVETLARVVRAWVVLPA
ncbi:MAG TPA: methyltransferase domain-containing protein [Candidatus Binatia bacterium]